MAVPRQHLGSGPVDMNNLPKDILDCDVCRQRLGLPPLHGLANSATSTANSFVLPKPSVDSIASSPQVVPMLGAPGMISSATADQLALNGLIVEEFKPPQPGPNAIQLGSLPPEVRQEFMRSLGLPLGARVMSAEIKGLGSAGIVLQAEPIEAKSDAGSKTSSEPLSQSAESVIPTPSVLPKEPAIDLEGERLELQQAAKINALSLECQAFEKQILTLSNQMEQFQSDGKKRMEQSDAVHKEILAMLEKRTAEVTELQLQLKAQQESFDKAQQEWKAAQLIVPEEFKTTEEAKTKEKLSESDKNGGKKKQPNKGKKPPKPIEIQ